MFFTRTHSFNSPVSKKELQKRLLGEHVRIHNLDFEIVDRENALVIIPYSEQEESIKTLPITDVDISEEGGQSKVTLTSKMRPADSGGPNLILIFCFFLFLAAFILHMVDKNGDWTVTYILLGIDVFIFSMFIFRLRTGYFDYVKKVHGYVQSKGDAIGANIKASVAM